MPIETRTTDSGKMYRWGKHGKWYDTREEAEKQAKAAYSAGYVGDRMDLDFTTSTESVRKQAEFGRLEITECRISKECVSPYRGASIPNWQRLGLEPNRIYNLYRPAEELEKAASSFNMVPITIEHPTELDTPVNEQQRVGSTGNNTRFESPYLVTSMKLWDLAAIKGVQDRTREEISIFQTFDVVMTSGEFSGERYDGIITNIVGNSVALTIKGRCGSDVSVGDSLDIEGSKLDKEAIIKMLKSKSEAVSDSDADEMAKAILEMLAEHEQSEIDDKKPAGDEASKPCDVPEKPAGDEDDMKDKKEVGDSIDFEAMLKAQKEEITAHFKQLDEARQMVAPIYGQVVGDSAEQVFDAVLKQNGRDVSSMPAAAKKFVVQEIINAKQSVATRTPVGDSSPADTAKFKAFLGVK